MRSNWSVEIGPVSSLMFDRIVEELGTLSNRPTVFFGGIGEPLSQCHLPQMIERVKSLGCRVKMTSNGTLLSEEKGRAIIDAGLDLLWVSIDGARPESCADLRLGAELPVVIENLKRFRRLRRPAHHPIPASRLRLPIPLLCATPPAGAYGRISHKKQESRLY